MVTAPMIEQMLKAGMHFGHRTSKWHPKCAPFIFTQRNGVHIFDLVKSRKMLMVALEFMEKFAAEGKIIMLVGTKMQAKKPIQKLGRDTGMPYVNEKWMGGCLTNFVIIKKMIKKYNDLIRDQESGALVKYTKKEQLDFDRKIRKLSLKVGGLTNMVRLPDALFVWDIKHERTAVVEARKKNVPIIGVCDTNSDPTGINYVIPANDDATKTIKLVLGLVGEAIKVGKNKSNSK